MEFFLWIVYSSYYFLIMVFICVINEGVKNEVDWTKTIIAKLCILGKGTAYFMSYYSVTFPITGFLYFQLMKIKFV